MSTPLISAIGMGKRFSRGFKRQHRDLAQELWGLFWRGRAGAPAEPEDDGETFWALQNLRFDVRRGEVLGVIGHNGAGKTTLLRILNGEMTPDAGEVRIHGQRSSLIDLAGGFSMTMTGRENIYYRGAHLGFSRAFLREKEQEIIDFAELGEFIDSPVKDYSSGMLMRLGFAVTVFAEPDVLLMDEILAVGDFLFQQKCLNQINKLKQRAAVVLVSHGMSTITQFADRVLLLDRGVPVFLGKPVEAIEAYYRLEESKQKLGSRLSRLSGREPEHVLAEPAAFDAFEWPDFGTLPGQEPLPARVMFEAPAARHGQGLTEEEALPVELRAVVGNFIHNKDAIDDVALLWLDERGEPLKKFRGADAATLQISFTLRRPTERLVIGVPLWNEQAVYVTAFGMQGRFDMGGLGAGRHSVRLKIPALCLNMGTYYPVVAFQELTEFIFRSPATPMHVTMSPAPLFWGLVTLDYHWERGVSAPVVEAAEIKW
ncbi:MAG TPA: ABC transporter ATP-binding protein [Terricaulis sp.]|nr:ABC transporter ATP-binding protein [Terricaulis sp.]